MLDEYIKNLAIEYLFYCRAMDDGGYTSDAEYQRLSADRMLCHDELIRVLGSEYDRPFDMQAYCRRLLSE
mgnify:FL=1